MSNTAQDWYLWIWGTDSYQKVSVVQVFKNAVKLATGDVVVRARIAPSVKELEILRMKHFQRERTRLQRLLDDIQKESKRAKSTPLTEMQES